MVCLYNKTETDFDHNGICVLDPSICTVSEVAGGSYELYLEHPFDKYEKFMMLAEDMIIKAPVPYTEIPAITMPATSRYELAEDADFWKKLPVYKAKPVTDDMLKTIRESYARGEATYVWATGRGFNKGAYAVYNSGIYQAKVFNISVTPGTDSSVWGWVAPLYGSSGQTGGGTYTPGETWSPALSVGATLIKIADYNGTYVQVKDLLGRIGYIDKSKLDEVTTESEVIPKQVIETQLFRIYSVESNEESESVHAYARHISYDYQGNSLMDCKIEEAAPADAIAVMQGALMIADNRTVACQFTDEKITQDWSFRNPVNALLDPDTGLVPKLKARLIRNNENFYILKNDNPRTGITIEHGANLRGVTWNRSVETVVTRVVPRCHNGNDEYLYLEHGGTWSSATEMTSSTWVENDDIYVESPIASIYPVPKIEVYDCQYSVGEEYTPPGSTTKVKRDEANCREEMLKDAQKRFTVDRCDGMEVSLTVEFVLLGDSEQYRQYRGLQRVNMYDKVTVKGRYMEETAQVTEYEYDCLRGRYNSITLGKIDSFMRRIAGCRVMNESITYSKLSPDLINRIRTMGGSASEDSGSSGLTPNGGSVIMAQTVRLVQTTIQTASIAGGQDGSVTVDLPTGVTQLQAVIPYGFVPENTWDTVICFGEADRLTRVINFHTVGTDTQKYLIKYLVAYYA